MFSIDLQLKNTNWNRKNFVFFKFLQFQIVFFIGKLGFQASTQNFKTLTGFSVFLTLNQYRRAGITEDKVAVPIPEVQVARADFRADHQHRTCCTIFDRVDRRLQTEVQTRQGTEHGTPLRGVPQGYHRKLREATHDSSVCRVYVIRTGH